MDKKIGNIVTIVLFFCFQFIAAENQKITVNIVNKYQEPVRSVEISIPFLIQVICEGFRPENDLQGFELLHDCTIQPYGTTQSSTYINGTITEKYVFTYIAVANKKGTLNIGPIIAQSSNGKTIKSDIEKIRVTDIVQHEYTGNEAYLLHVSTDTRKVYVGQKVKVNLKFCYNARFENLAIESVAIDNVEFGSQDTDWKNGKIVLGGKEYSTKEMSFDIYPKNSGTLVVPPFKASFIPERSQDIGLFGLFGFSNSKVVESFPKQIEVLSLPAYNKGKVDAIGRFDSVELQASVKKAQVAEGIIVKMIVHGEGNLAVMHHPDFQAPEGMHFYEGNSSIELDKKTFEWVVQSEKPGLFTIEPQIFIYFDPINEQYKQLATNSLQLTIEGKSIEVEQDENIFKIDELETKEKDDLLDDLIENLDEKQNKKNYYTSEKFYKQNSSSLLLNIIKLILFILLLVVIFYLIGPYIMKIFFFKTLHYRILFWKYYYLGNVESMYQLFDRLALDYNFGLQSIELQDCFFKFNLSNEAFENWKNFITMLLQFNFAKEKAIEDKKLALDLAKQWFGVILNCCKEIQKNNETK